MNEILYKTPVSLHKKIITNNHRNEQKIRLYRPTGIYTGVYISTDTTQHITKQHTNPRLTYPHNNHRYCPFSKTSINDSLIIQLLSHYVTRQARSSSKQQMTQIIYLQKMKSPPSSPMLPFNGRPPNFLDEKRCCFQCNSFFVKSLVKSDKEIICYIEFFIQMNEQDEIIIFST